MHFISPVDQAEIDHGTPLGSIETAELSYVVKEEGSRSERELMAQALWLAHPSRIGSQPGQSSTKLVEPRKATFLFEHPDETVAIASARIVVAESTLPVWGCTRYIYITTTSQLRDGSPLQSFGHDLEETHLVFVTSYIQPLRSITLSLRRVASLASASRLSYHPERTLPQCRRERGPRIISTTSTSGHRTG